jgi:hypothetical protein
MEFAPIYSNETFPLGGYDSYIFRVLLNPTGKIKEDWWRGIVEDSDCADCATLRATGDDTAHCDRCTALRSRKGCAAVAIYGGTKIQGFDFSTPESAVATFLQPELTDEFLGWLLALPDALWMRRQDELKKKLSGFSTETTPIHSRPNMRRCSRRSRIWPGWPTSAAVSIARLAPCCRPARSTPWCRTKRWICLSA